MLQQLICFGHTVHKTDEMCLGRNNVAMSLIYGLYKCVTNVD